MATKVVDKRRNYELAIERAQELGRRKWNADMRAVNAVYRTKHGSDLPAYKEAAIALGLESLDSHFRSNYGQNYRTAMESGTYPENVSSFIHHGFGAVAALISNLSIDEVISMQSMDRRVGELFYIDFVASETKGSVAAGDKLFGYLNGPAAGRGYSSKRVPNETIGTGDGTEVTFAFTLQWLPVLPGNLAITAGSVVAVFNEAGVGSGTGVTSASVDYATGVGTITFSAAVANGAAVLATYAYNMDRSYPAGINLDVTSIPIMAESRRLRTNWLLEAGIDYEKAHGRSADEDLLKAAVGEIEKEISEEVYEALLAGATGGSATFDTTPTSDMIRVSDWNHQIYDFAVSVRNDIYNSTRHGFGNVIVGGLDFCNIVEALPDTLFTGETYGSEAPVGPHFIGTLGKNFRCVKNFGYDEDKALMAYKGSDNLRAGAVFSTYIPLYTTNPVALDDTKVRRGLGRADAFEIVNPDMYAVITLADVPNP